MDSITPNSRDTAPFSVLIEFEDSSSYSPESSRCVSPLSYCSWDSRENNDNGDHRPFESRVDGTLDQDILDGIKNLDIGTSYRSLRNTHSTSHLSAESIVPLSHRLDHRKYILSASSRVSSGSLSCSTVESFEVPRPASPSLLLGLDHHLRHISIGNQGDLPEPSSDIHGQFERHTAGQFQAVLAVPVYDKNSHLDRIADADAVVLKHADDDKLFTLVYGISLLKGLTETQVPGSDQIATKDCRPDAHAGAITYAASGDSKRDSSFANIISVIATRLETHHDILRKHPLIFQRMKEAPSEYPYAQVYPVPIEHEDQPPPYAEAVPSSIFDYKILDQIHPVSQNTTIQTSTMSPSMSPTLQTPTSSHTPRAPSRVEDSVEAIDRLEEDIEALGAQFTHAMTPSQDNTAEMLPQAASSSKSAAKLSPIGARQEHQTLGRSKTVGFQLQRKMRRSSSSSLKKEDEKLPSAESDEKVAKRRSMVARPNSLLPPKPLAKSTRPITTSTFELPGVAVSRRLKEQKEARLAAKQEQDHQSPTQKTPSPRVSTPSLHRVKSTKRLTIPNFELPGEAISRRKRLEHEERLRRQEEKERKAREFKARPIPASIFGGGRYPRETLSSRMRQGKSDGDENCRQAPKRASILTAQGRTTPISSTPGSETPRGRNLEHKSSTGQASRATSTSTIGQISNISVEDINMQRQLGKQIVAQDSLFMRNKEQERKKRLNDLVKPAVNGHKQRQKQVVGASKAMTAAYATTF
ncbi:hypothetical protein Cpir12675_005650 [Ceratocystis pirilliformis]|uniref:TPX2 C-terminal domain-containing protein n=1 Tax=Ceratocystis pirilliformis TaxID=259994 RepID=A0ABR3YPG4_9PEZI